MKNTPSRMSTERSTPEELKFQTWALKVHMHCGGCKKKVKKVLHNIDGVYATDVDSQQQKVTVTGSVDAETVMKKLEKAGKHAEPWPEMPAKKEAKLQDGKLKQKMPKSEGNGSRSGVGSDPKGNSVETSPDAVKMGGGGDVKEVAADKNGGTKKKKNGPKEGCSSYSDNITSTNGRASVTMGSPPPAADSIHTSLPQAQAQAQLVYPYPPMYYMPSAYALNYYSMAHPSTGSSYNSVPPAFPNMHTSAKTYPHASPDVYDDFGDEEEECGCSVM